MDSRFLRDPRIHHKSIPPNGGLFCYTNVIVITRLKGMFINDSTSHSVEIPIGPIQVHVQGESWGLKNLGKVRLQEPVKFSLTPRNAYHIEHGWPDGVFFNVNPFPSTATIQKKLARLRQL